MSLVPLIRHCVLYNITTVTRDNTSYHSSLLQGEKANVCVFSYHQALVASVLDDGSVHGAELRVFIWLSNTHHLHTK